MPNIDTEAERERLDRIFDEIAGKMPEEPRKTQKEIDEENRRARSAVRGLCNGLLAVTRYKLESTKRRLSDG